MRNFFQRQFAFTLIFAVAGIYCLYFVSQGIFTYNRSAYVTTDHISLSAQVPGTLSQLHVVTDQHVEAGDLLFVINPAAYQIEVDAAQAQVKLAEAGKKAAQDAMSRATALLASNTADLTTAAQRATETAQRTAAGNILSANEAAEAAKQGLLKAQYALKQTEVFAPVSGYIAPFNTRVGEFVNVGQDVLAVVDDSKWRIVANLKERHVAMLQSGHEVWFRLGSDPLSFHSGKITAISKAIMREDMRQSVIPYISPNSGWIRLPRRFPVEIQMDKTIDTLPLFMGSDADVFIRF